MGHETVFFSAADANGSGIFPLSIAVMADIHGNDTALERCLTDAEKKGIRNYLFLGDYAGELAHPERVMRLLYGLSDRYSCLFIRGNKENYWLNYRKDGEKGWKEKDSITGCMPAWSRCGRSSSRVFRLLLPAMAPRNGSIRKCFPTTRIRFLSWRKVPALSFSARIRMCSEKSSTGA